MINFGIIGAGDIARKFADAVRQLDNAEVIAVASKSLDRAQEWAAREHIPSYYGNYAELLANPRIDAVYIATTTNAHYDNILHVCKPANMFSAKNLWYGLLTRHLPSVALPNKKTCF